jgi:hypothetical protein
LGLAADDISSRDVDVSKPERATVEESVEVSGEKREVVLGLVLLAIFLLLWYGVF